MKVIEPVETMQRVCAQLQREGKQIHFVPTMGALHRGHMALIERAASGGDSDDHKASAEAANGPSDASSVGRIVVVVSIFVNPIQFNSREDFLNYPKTLERDLEACRKTRLVDYVFAPRVSQMFPRSGQAAAAPHQLHASCRAVVVAPTKNCAASQQLEAASRPGHFEGMLTIVCKLFNIVRPNRAYFGEKDYQQLLLVRSMCNDLNMGTRICAVRTVRESDTSLPLSSRNARLTLRQRLQGAVMYDILMSAKEAIEQKCCREFILDHHHHQDGPPLGQAELDAVLLSSRLVAQCLSNAAHEMDHHQHQNNKGSNDDDDGDEEDEDGDGDENGEDSQTHKVHCDYLELRCANDLTVIHYNDHLQCYDCQLNCVANKLHKQQRESQCIDYTLEARLLIALIVAKVRLLDNMEVKLNLDYETKSPVNANGRAR